MDRISWRRDGGIRVTGIGRWPFPLSAAVFFSARRSVASPAALLLCDPIYRVLATADNERLRLRDRARWRDAMLVLRPGRRRREAPPYQDRNWHPRSADQAPPLSSSKLTRLASRRFRASCGRVGKEHLGLRASGL